MSRACIPRYTHRDAMTVAMVAGGFALAMAVAVFVRASFRVTPNFVQVLTWQLLVWLPWVAVPVVANRVGQRRVGATGWFARHAITACAVSALMVVWSSFISDQISPYYGVLGTKHGAFAYFFVFWFFIDFLAYWIVVAYLEYSRVRMELRAREEELAGRKSAVSPANPESVSRRSDLRVLKVTKNGKQHIVQIRDIDWVEAQGYYAALHLGNRSFLIRKSLRELSHDLRQQSFVRIHRSTLVNLRFVSEIDTDRVTLADGTERRISREGRKRLKHALSRKSP